ncbi:MAG: flagellar biosynthesis regulator FlaF [Janthinobacterium lividum]
MAMYQAGARAYQAQAARRSLRDQEADVFRGVTGGLRAAKTNPLLQGRAVADNVRLWLMLSDVLRDPANALPAKMRAEIVSVGQALLREMQRPEPDLDFLIHVNENLTAGLSGVS